MRRLVLALGMASAAWNQAAPGIWINRASAPDGNFPRLSAIATSPAELGANFLTAVYVIPGAAFDLAVSCITMTNAGSLSGSLVASFNTFTFRQTTINDTLKTGLQSKASQRGRGRQDGERERAQQGEGQEGRGRGACP